MFQMHSGPGSSEEALESAQYPVRQQRGKPFGRPAFSLLHSVLHHRGAGLLQHWRSLRTHERQRFPRHRLLHVKVRQPLRLTAKPPRSSRWYIASCWSLLAEVMSEDFYCMSVTWYYCTDEIDWTFFCVFFFNQFSPGHCPKMYTDNHNIVSNFLSDTVIFKQPNSLFFIEFVCTQTTCKFVAIFGAKPVRISLPVLSDASFILIIESKQRC